MRILITGSNGLLGQHIVGQLQKRGISFLATSQGENRNPDCPNENYAIGDICDHAQMRTLIETFQPTHIIHTAAVTNVDLCEQEHALCRAVNVDAVQNLFSIAEEKNIHFQLLSTDFVFDGEAGPYKEEDAVNPLSAYAVSKVDAELILLQSGYKNWSIARTIIIYGPGKNLSRGNLVEWALDALPKEQPMRLVNDQFRAPTWAGDLAWGCIEICTQEQTGIFHLSGPETMSVVDIVKKIAKHCGYSTANIEEISSKTLNQAAKRPPYTGFILDKAKKVLNYNPKQIEETIDLLRMTNATRTTL